MISKQASTLPRRLLRRYGTSDPFELADCLGITILECHDFKLLLHFHQCQLVH